MNVDGQCAYCMAQGHPLDGLESTFTFQNTPPKLLEEHGWTIIVCDECLPQFLEDSREVA